MRSNTTQLMSSWASLVAQSVKKVKAAQSCPNLCDPGNRCPPGSSVHGIFQASILKWVAIPHSRGSSQPESLVSPALAGRFFIIVPHEKPLFSGCDSNNIICSNTDGPGDN